MRVSQHNSPASEVPSTTTTTMNNPIKTTLSGPATPQREVIAAAAAAATKFNEKTLQDYEVLSVIGNGCFGTCFKVRDKTTGELYAWKGMDYGDLTGESQESLVGEINVLRQLQHPNIVQYHHHLINPEAQMIFLIMEYCAGGDLAQLIVQARRERRRFEERYVWRVLFQLCRALQVCHTRLEDGMILHRDIKPANIFLDACGNAKLGDFGLARMLRRNERFAKSIVGTPYYMSPEIVSGARYDRTSDVWALGCLVYEMCALQPPFRGHAFEQLSTNIANGQFRQIPSVYSDDLQEMIAFMLAVAKDQRPGVEVITRHPVVVRNVSDVGSDQFPQLIEAEVDFLQGLAAGEAAAAGGCQTPLAGRVGGKEPRCKLQYSPERDNSAEEEEDFERGDREEQRLSSTILSEMNSFCGDREGGGGQRRMSISGVFTPDLRAELFYSSQRRTRATIQRQQSDPALYESIRRDESSRTSAQRRNAEPRPAPGESPGLLTQAVFDRLLQERLLAIRTHESLLLQQSANLAERERQLNMKERRLLVVEESLLARERQLETELRVLEAAQQALAAEQKALEQRHTVVDTATSPLQLPMVGGGGYRSKPVPPLPPPPPIPPRKSARGGHDDTYCSIEPNESMLMMPTTIAKLDMSSLAAAPKGFPSMRRVTFQSPKQFITYDIENQPPPLGAAAAPPLGGAQKRTQLQASMSSKGSSDDSNETQSTTATNTTTASSSTNSRRGGRSLLSSLFGLHRLSGKETHPPRQRHTNTATITPAPAPPAKPIIPPNVAVMKDPKRGSFLPKPEQVLAKCDTADLTSIWTKENKRAAFDLLAAMNSNTGHVTTGQAAGPVGGGIENQNIARHRLRHSSRDRHVLQRNRMRRSLVVSTSSAAMGGVASAAQVGGSTSSHLSMLGSREQILV